MNTRRFILFISILISFGAGAQNMPVGQWRSHLPYNSAISLATDVNRMYVATRYSFYVYAISYDEITPYSKASGMSDIGMAEIAFDPLTETVVLAYSNSNIDLFKDGNFYNIPDLKIKSVTGTKAINHIYVEDGLAYLSTDIGIVVINLEKQEIKETYTFTRNGQNIRARGLAVSGNYFYAATSGGVYKADKNAPNLQAFSSWIPLDTTRNYNSIAATGGSIFVARPDSLFAIEADTLRSVYKTPDSAIFIRSVDDGIDGIWVIENNDSTFQGQAKKMNGAYQFTDSFSTLGFATEIVELNDPEKTKYIANEFSGMKIRKQQGEPYNAVLPDGPSDVANFDIFIGEEEMLVAHGGYDDTYRPLNSGSGFSVYKNGEWKIYRVFDYPPFGDSIRDITDILKAPSGEIFAGSTQKGLFILKPDGSYECCGQNKYIDPSVTGSNLFRISGMAIDNDGIFWATVFGGLPHELIARTADGTWYQYSIPITRGLAHSAAHLAIDDDNQKWFAAPSGGGVIVFDDNHTPEVPSDDEYVQLLAGEGSGGLPDNEVFCIVKDRDGSMWIGTANGIGIVSCPGQVIERQCEAEKRIVQFDQFAGYLFQNEQVRAIAVDGANRKWIGTNNGVWLVSPEGDEILERFNAENSPLPSNIIQSIAVDHKTGDVYFGTELGLVAYRGTATEAIAGNKELITYPNPVPSGYSGQIAINGFPENADVRITDIAGQLVYRTTANGGQAVWSGKDYTGRRPQSGVYLIFGTNKDGSETVKGKMVFME